MRAIHICAAGAFVLAAACAGGRVDATRLEDGIAAAVARQQDGEVVLAELVTSDWTQVGVFGPYARLAILDRCIGGGSTARLTRGIDSRDDVTLLVFTFPDGSHESATVPLATAIFAPETDGKIYARPQARFRVTQGETGHWSHLVPASGVTRSCTDP